MIPLRQSLELRDCWAVQMGSLLMQKKKRTELDTTKKVVGRERDDENDTVKNTVAIVATVAERK